MLTYRGPDHAPHTGKLVVHRRWATKVAFIFHKLYDARFPIPRKLLVDRYGAVDMRSTKVALIFHKLYDARFLIPRKLLVDRYCAVDMRSTKAHNTSVFNCRYRNNVCIGCEWGGSSWPTDYKHFSATNR